MRNDEYVTLMWQKLADMIDRHAITLNYHAIILNYMSMDRQNCDLSML